MRIHLLSDLHVETRQFVPSTLDADVTILAGDIHTKGRGVAWARNAFPGRVLFVPGNHDFWKGNTDRTLAKMKIEAAKDDRISVLQRDVVVIAGVRFLGATSWTDFRSTGNEPLAMWDAQQQMNDYKRIRHSAEYKRWRPQNAQLEAIKTRTWLREQLAVPFDGKTVVITHHAPSPMSLERTRDGTHLDASYANRWEDLFGPDVSVWVHGHSHSAVDYELMGTRVLSNPRGYTGEDTEFNPWLEFEV